VRTGIEPGIAASETADAKVAAIEVSAIDVRDLELAARRRRNRCRDVENIIIVEI
jgi:hypothetical protein